MKSIEEINEMNKILTLSVEVQACDVDVADAGEDASFLLGIILDDVVAAAMCRASSSDRGRSRSTSSSSSLK
jgi:hypothetical protein